MKDIVAVVTDLFFQARISSAARAAGRPLVVISSERSIPEDAVGTTVLVDLDAALDVVEVIRSFKSAGAETVIAFGPHLDVARSKAARAAGADRVLAKSKFVTELPRILRRETGLPSA